MKIKLVSMLLLGGFAGLNCGIVLASSAPRLTVLQQFEKKGHLPAQYNNNKITERNKTENPCTMLKEQYNQLKKDYDARCKRYTIRITTTPQ